MIHVDAAATSTSLFNAGTQRRAYPQRWQIAGADAGTKRPGAERTEQRQAIRLRAMISATAMAETLCICAADHRIKPMFTRANCMRGFDYAGFLHGLYG
jgi:hypothetical protein